MTKSLIVDPSEMRKASVLSAPDVPVCQYDASFADERKRFSDSDLVGVYEDMVLVREFETMLQKIKMEGSYEGVEYNHMGPAHLSIGQEASAVGQALTLGVDDHILGSHRSHGEILAKGMSAIRKLSDDDLMKVMKEFDNGAISESHRSRLLRRQRQRSRPRLPDLRHHGRNFCPRNRL